jgi:hypothetical protein
LAIGRLAILAGVLDGADAGDPIWTEGLVVEASKNRGDILLDILSRRSKNFIDNDVKLVVLEESPVINLVIIQILTV